MRSTPLPRLPRPPCFPARRTPRPGTPARSTSFILAQRVLVPARPSSAPRLDFLPERIFPRRIPASLAFPSARHLLQHVVDLAHAHHPAAQIVVHAVLPPARLAPVLFQRLLGLASRARSARAMCRRARPHPAPPALLRKRLILSSSSNSFHGGPCLIAPRCPSCRRPLPPGVERSSVRWRRPRVWRRSCAAPRRSPHRRQA